MRHASRRCLRSNGSMIASGVPLDNLRIVSKRARPLLYSMRLRTLDGQTSASSYGSPSVHLQTHLAGEYLSQCLDATHCSQMVATRCARTLRLVQCALHPTNKRRRAPSESVSYRERPIARRRYPSCRATGTARPCAGCKPVIRTRLTMPTSPPYLSHLSEILWYSPSFCAK